MPSIAVFPLATYADVPRSHWDGSLAVDLFCASGTPVLAVFDGSARAADFPLGGHTVLLTADDGTEAYYAHLLAPGKSGRVQAGQVIGNADNSGNAEGTATHLHFALGSIDNNGAGTIAPWDALAGVSVVVGGTAPSGGPLLPMLPSLGELAANPWARVAALGLAGVLVFGWINPRPWPFPGGYARRRNPSPRHCPMCGSRILRNPSRSKSCDPSKRFCAFWMGEGKHRHLVPFRASVGYDREVEQIQKEVNDRRRRAEFYSGERREVETALGGGVDRPPWAVGVTNAALERFAREHGENARSPGWWERAGLYRHHEPEARRVPIYDAAGEITRYATVKERPKGRDKGELEDVITYLKQDKRGSAVSRSYAAARAPKGARRYRKPADLPF
jgi:hypothetical protein